VCRTAEQNLIPEPDSAVYVLIAKKPRVPDLGAAHC
jgi:hypothetical protein